MGFVKTNKTKAYFKRYQVKYARRRIGKTDYRARLRLTNQDKNKYNTPKYRFVVRFTNRDIICQVAYATMAGDIIVAAAYAHELPKYGLEFGLSNYAAAYCTGLLLARRVLTKFGLADTYEGQTEVDGEDYNVEEEDDAPRPFRALLDVGLARTSTGARVFGALKGACDGGIDIPHNEKRFAGYDKDDKSLDTETFQKYLLGGHMGEYAEMLQEEEPEKYQSHFAKMVSEEVDPGDLEDLYKEVHEKIRADPSHKKTEKKWNGTKKTFQTPKSTYEERKKNLKEKLAELKEAAEEEDDDESDDE